MMRAIRYGQITLQAIVERWVLWSVLTVGMIVLYYAGLLMVTIVRFHEIPNYIVVYDITNVYRRIFEGTPSFKDALPILIDETWIETGYKNPDYYNIATWSYMLIPPKMLVVAIMAALLATFAVLSAYSRQKACPVTNRRRLYAAAGVGSGLVGMTSATLTWIACCSTPSWIVGLAMLGMSSTLASWLEPFGKIISVSGLALLLWIIYAQLKNIDDNMPDPETRSR